MTIGRLTFGLLSRRPRRRRRQPFQSSGEVIICGFHLNAKLKCFSAKMVCAGWDKFYKTFMTSLTDSPFEFEPQKICTIYAYIKGRKYASVM